MHRIWRQFKFNLESFYGDYSLNDLKFYVIVGKNSMSDRKIKS